MFRKKLDKKGQGSAELILITGGLIVIILLVGSYISNITDKTQQNLNSLLKEENKIVCSKLLQIIIHHIIDINIKEGENQCQDQAKKYLMLHQSF